MKWFHHDTDMHRNRKIRKLIRTHGATGYAFWCVLLEKLYEIENGFQIEADELWFEDIAEDLKLADYRTPIRILDTLSELELINKQLWQEHVISSPAIAKRGDSYIVKRTQEAEKKQRYRERQKAMSTVDKEGTEGQTWTLSTSDPDPYSDLDPEKEEFKQDLIKRSIPPKEKPNPKSGYSPEARSSSIPIEVLDPEPHPTHQTRPMSHTPPESHPKPLETTSLYNPTSQAGIEPQNHAGELTAVPCNSLKKKKSKLDYSPDFEAWWAGYYQFCLQVGASAGKKPEAWTEWLRRRYEVETPAEFWEGNKIYQQYKCVQFSQRGQAIGVTHGSRYVRDEGWREELDRSRTTVQIVVQSKAEKKSQQFEDDFYRARAERLAKEKERETA